MFEKKKNFTFCMYEKFHTRLTKFAKKAGYRSLSEFFAKIGQQEIDKAKKKKGDKDDG
jgi:predicted amidophosphoribosyltransferase